MALVVPYQLAFGEQCRFDVILIGIRDEVGRTGWGEATILTGYTTETVEDGWALTLDLLRRCRTTEDIRRMAPTVVKIAPFIVSAFLTALDWLEAHPHLRRVGRFPLLGTVNGKSDNYADLESEIAALIATGYRTLKVKIGWEVEKDLKQVDAVRKIANSRAKLRIDANQGYTLDQATEFLSRLNPADIELVEQPCAADDWDAAVAVKRVAGVPIMLDESIYTLTDVARAASLGCADYVKLKLMKLGNLDSLERSLRMIAELGMTAVLGNGVATDLGCWMEIAVALGNVSTAGEMNGFLKTRSRLLTPSLRMEGADVIINGELPEIDEAVIAQYAVSQAGSW